MDYFLADKLARGLGLEKRTKPRSALEARDIGAAGKAVKRAIGSGLGESVAKHVLGTGVVNAAKGIDAIVQEYREKTLRDSRSGLESDWWPRALQAMAQPMPGAPNFRVVTVRHGMGYHNDLAGANSFANRDAKLNHIGEQQARDSGKVLLEAGILKQLDLVVVSPFTRTLQTATTLQDTFRNF